MSIWQTEYVEAIASYIVYVENGMYYAYNCKTGKIDYKGTDATAVIQSAIDAIPVGGKVLIKAGEYKVNGTLSMKSNVVLEGEMRDITLLNMEGLPDGSLGINCTGVSDFAIRSFTIDMKRTTNIAGMFGIGVYGSATAYVSNFLIKDMRIRNTGAHGIQVYYAEKYAIKGNLLENCWRDGISCARAQRNSVIANNIIMNAYDTGILQGSDYITEWTENNVVEGNVVDKTDVGPGIIIQRARRCTVVGNTVRNAGTHGILIRDAVVDGVSYPSQYNIITSNVCHGCGGYGINELNSDYNIIRQNSLLDNVSGSLRLGGTHTCIGHDDRIVHVGGSGKAITGNPDTTYALLMGTQWMFNPRFQRWLWFAELIVQWDPKTTSGAVRLYNATDGVVIAESVPGVVGVRTDRIDITDALRGYDAEKMIRLDTHGDGTTAPELYFGYIRMIVTDNHIY